LETFNIDKGEGQNTYGPSHSIDVANFNRLALVSSDDLMNLSMIQTKFHGDM